MATEDADEGRSGLRIQGRLAQHAGPGGRDHRPPEPGPRDDHADRDLVTLAILREMGLRVPEDIALVSLDESEAAPYQEVPLTAVRSPKFELGVHAVEMLLRLISGERPQPPEVVLPMPLMIRRSSPPKFIQEELP